MVTRFGGHDCDAPDCIEFWRGKGSKAEAENCQKAEVKDYTFEKGARVFYKTVRKRAKRAKKRGFSHVNAVEYTVVGRFRARMDLRKNKKVKESGHSNMYILRASHDPRGETVEVEEHKLMLA